MAQFDVEYDVVCIGGGASGKSAAYTIAKESDLSVVVLEKKEETGGSSIYAEGTCASESVEQQSRPHPDYPGELPEGAHFPTHEEHVQRYIDYSHHRANLDVAKAFVYNSGETISMYKDLGIEYTDVTIYAFDQPLELYTFHRPEGLGQHCQDVLLRACENEGIDIFTSTPAKELIFEDGKIVGVLAQDADGNDMRIGCKYVVLATGGFGNNMEMVKKYSWMPQLAETNYQSVPTENTGDGIRMAEAAGAHLKDIGALMIIGCTDGRTLGSNINGGGYQPNLWVDTKGERFCNEAVANSFADTGNTIARRDDGIVYSVMDEETIKRLETEARWWVWATSFRFIRRCPLCAPRSTRPFLMAPPSRPTPSRVWPRPWACPWRPSRPPWTSTTRLALPVRTTSSTSPRSSCIPWRRLRSMPPSSVRASWFPAAAFASTATSR